MSSRNLAILAVLLGTCAVAGADGASPVARWDFGTEESAPLQSVGAVQRDQAGPLPPEYPDFAPDNTAIRLGGDGARIVVPDPGPASIFDFDNGDAITVEAWVALEAIRDGQPVYIIGKGRTNNPRVPRDNQNWAVRLTGAGGGARLSFLFATAAGTDAVQWHRWTSTTGFSLDTGWHHVAAAYRFGAPTSIRAWIDGVPVDGTWDLGGATTAAPVVDDDEIWIGSSLGGNPGSSFQGSLDSIAIYRELLSDAVVARRFQRTGGPRLTRLQTETMPHLDVPAGTVLFTVAEGMPTHERWLNEDEVWPEERLRWTGPLCLLPRIPLRYDDWGIRDSWESPVLLRMAADVTLPPGPRRFLVRGRALGRLWIDGELVARTEALIEQPPNGEEPITPIPEPPHPGLRLPGYRMQEVIGAYTVPAPEDGGLARCRVVFETVVGGKNLRTETGEICIAVETEDERSFTVLTPSGADAAPIPLTDAAIEPQLQRIEAQLAALDTARRRQAAASRDSYWAMRRDAARAWAAQHPPPAVPVVEGRPEIHPVDAFLETRIAQQRARQPAEDTRAAEEFHAQVLPLLQEACFRCHGEKARGGLRLDSREGMLLAGDSEVPAVVPGNPASSELLARITSEDADRRMPPTETGLAPESIDILRRWIASGAPWPALAERASIPLAARLDDEAFLRRLYLDTVGVPPEPEVVWAYLSDRDPGKVLRWVDRLLADDRFADHWMGYWLDMLAENPTLINASLNSSGPFRWFLYDALRDGKPVDRLVTELILMRGGAHEGGSAGFALAAENDAPFAAKGHILASAFLGVEMQCARCHDAPYHRSTQRDLFALAAMLQRKPAAAPVSSSVPDGFFAALERPPLIRVTLRPGEEVAPAWPFDSITGVDENAVGALLDNPDDSRARLAALITAPQNTRFPQVMANRVWERLMGAGIVEPVHDWEGGVASHPELLAWLAHTFVSHDYDLRHLMRRILTSTAYQREAVGNNRGAPPATRHFNAPDRRRMTAEQVVDALHHVTGTRMDVEELTFVHSGRRAISNRLTLGTPTRAWMFASLANERDRPSLTLPRAQVVADVLEAFGWTGSRQKPITDREVAPNVLQPGVLANGTLVSNLTRASDGSTLAQLAVDAPTPEVLVNTLFLRVLGRMPAATEFVAFVATLTPGFDTRLRPEADIVPPVQPAPLPRVTWFNHLQSEANTIQLALERRVREGPPPDRRLEPAWRVQYEDAVWSLINHHEFVWVP